MKKIEFSEFKGVSRGTVLKMYVVRHDNNEFSKKLQDDAVNGYFIFEGYTVGSIMPHINIKSLSFEI